jgi:hypothetical protein
MHALLYPILYSWQVLFYSFFEMDSFLWFKWIAIYYYLLFLAVIYLAVKSINAQLGVVFVVLAAFTYGLFFSALQFHLESIRLYLIVISWLVLYESFKSKNSFYQLSGLILGLQAGIHFIGLVLSLVMIASILVLPYYPLMKRIRIFAVQGFVFMLFGAVHYLFEGFLGDGYWIKMITGK